LYLKLRLPDTDDIILLDHDRPVDPSSVQEGSVSGLLILQIELIASVYDDTVHLGNPHIRWERQIFFIHASVSSSSDPHRLIEDKAVFLPCVEVLQDDLPLPSLFLTGLRSRLLRLRRPSLGSPAARR